MKPFCLTIAGADPTSGAGIQADIRTFDRIGVHPFSVLTAITYQTAAHFYGYKSLSDELDRQLDAVLINYPIKVVKIGMIPDVKTLDIIIQYIKQYSLDVVYDPVSISSAGERISTEGLELEIERDLFPYVKVLTPNLSEASYYSNKELIDAPISNLKEAASIILEKMYFTKESEIPEKAVIIKSGGMKENKVFDLLLINKKSTDGFTKSSKIFEKKKIDLNENVHGSGCVFSSAIAAFLSKGVSLEESINQAELFFNDKFQNFIKLSEEGAVIDLTLSEDKLAVMNQIKEIFGFISNSKEFSKLIPEVRMNISGSLPNAKYKSEIAGIEGRITIINGYPKASGDIKFGVTDHTARLILAAKEFDDSINFVMNLKYNDEWIKNIQDKTDLVSQEIKREHQPETVKSKEYSTMQWLIKESIRNTGRIPDIIWDKGSMGKEPIIRLFGPDSKAMIQKLAKIIRIV